MRTLLRISTLMLIISLLIGQAEVRAQGPTPQWQPYDPARVDGKVLEAAVSSGPLPAGCPVPQPKSHYVIGVAQTSRDRDPWRELMNKEIAESAYAYPQFSVIFADAQGSYGKQIEDVQNFLMLGIDLLIISPIESDHLTDSVAQVYRQCIPVIVLDRHVNGDEYSIFIGANNQAIGEAAGHYAANWCAEHHRVPCNVIELRGLEGSPPAKDRGIGFRMGISDTPDVKIVASDNADWLRELALDRATQMFTKHSDIAVIYAHNDSMAEAARVASQNAHLDLNGLLFIGIDGLPTDEGGLVSVLNKRLAVTYVYPTGGLQAIEWALQMLINHVNPPHWVELPFTEVRIDNAQTICNQYHCALSTQQK
jgi:ribose transport system substrate-binding protein